MCKSVVYFSAQHFWLVPPHFVCSGNIAQTFRSSAERVTARPFGEIYFMLEGRKIKENIMVNDNT